MADFHCLIHALLHVWAGRCWLVGFHMMVLHHCIQQLVLCNNLTQSSPGCLVMFTVVKIPFCCPHCCVRVFPDFALCIVLLSKLRLRDEREHSIWWKNVLLQGGSPWETVSFSSAMLASRPKAAAWILWGTAPVFKKIMLLSAQLDIGISLLWVSCQCQPQLTCVNLCIEIAHSNTWTLWNVSIMW